MSRGLVGKDENPSAATASAMLEREARRVCDVRFSEDTCSGVACTG